jgi:serine/threonine protein kinase
MGPLGRPKITTGLDKVRREIDLMRQVWHPNVLVLESVIDDPDEDALILVLEYAPQGQVMEFDSKRLKYRNHIFSVAGSPTTPAPASSNNVALDSPPAAVAAPASSTSTTSTAASADSSSHDKPISESILRKILHDVLAGLEYRQSATQTLRPLCVHHFRQIDSFMCCPVF